VCFQGWSDEKVRRLSTKGTNCKFEIGLRYDPLPGLVRQPVQQPVQQCPEVNKRAWVSGAPVGATAICLLAARSGDPAPP